MPGAWWWGSTSASLGVSSSGPPSPGPGSMAGGAGGGHGVVVTGSLRTVVVGDALLTTDLMVSALDALDDGISIDAALDFGPPDEAELDRLALLLAEARNVARAHCRVAGGGWDKRFANSAFTPEMEGKTVGIVGFGEIGSAMARKLRGSGVRLLAHDPFVASDRIAGGGAEPVDLGRLLEESDFVTLHARPESGAPPLIGRAELGRMRPTAILVNTARAALLDTEVLVDALARASLGGAALDVHDAEPLGPDHPLLGLDNVTLTPHLASSTKECVEKSPRLLVDDLRSLFRGGVPAHALNPEVVGDGWTGGGTS